MALEESPDAPVHTALRRRHSHTTSVSRDHQTHPRHTHLHLTPPQQRARDKPDPVRTEPFSTADYPSAGARESFERQPGNRPMLISSF